ncbi:activator of HSP90 ATPase [Leptospira perolatii]|uniref:Activator of HSP90 ATPase n=1 Tax=Leptospira perolatii TaxID=2023191 RepID=A0A2M9ZQM0_9LEPT|nr:SRPBCC domain-containing protein [Leptospira perolatii]PJZ68300.1 activator of HSP90 ATPase [Leptospira perolatii]PJZ74233.1 activator of HSP90 ATPase [Leptospira perolatii]
MPDIIHRVGINAKPEKVYKALTTISGLSHWWVSDTTGNANLNGIILFGFTDMKVEKLIKNKFVQWNCIRGPKEWLGTTITFKLVYKEKQTYVLFTHANWAKPVEFMYHCSTKWATFLLGLRNWIERGEGHPAPYDVKIHLND